MSLRTEGRRDGRLVGRCVGRAALVSISQLRHVKSGRGGRRGAGWEEAADEKSISQESLHNPVRWCQDKEHISLAGRWGDWREALATGRARWPSVSEVVEIGKTR